jgi:hypothetical protein
VNRGIKSEDKVSPWFDRVVSMWKGAGIKWSIAGIERRSIFKKQRSYAHFLELPSKMPERFELKVHRYVLMRNHSEFITEIMPVVRHPQHGSLRKRFLPECEMFSAPTASPVALGKAVPILADGVKVSLKCHPRKVRAAPHCVAVQMIAAPLPQIAILQNFKIDLLKELKQQRGGSGGAM